MPSQVGMAQSQLHNLLLVTPSQSTPASSRETRGFVARSPLSLLLSSLSSLFLGIRKGPARSCFFVAGPAELRGSLARGDCPHDPPIGIMAPHSVV